MSKHFVLRSGCWDGSCGVTFEKDTCYFWEDHFREGGPTVVRDTWDILNLEENDKLFKEYFLNKLEELRNPNTSATCDKIIAEFNKLPFNADPDYYKKLNIKLEQKYYVLKNKNCHLEWDITAKSANYDEVYDILKVSSNYRKNDKPRLLGSGEIWEICDYSWKNPKTNRVGYFTYHKCIFKSGHDCIPERIFWDDAEWRRVK